MAIVSFSAIDQSTIWDVLNNTYGSPDDIVKLMTDNNFPNINTYPVKGQIFNFDDTLVENQNNLQTNLAQTKFSTRDRQSTNEANMIYYEQNNEAEYTSNSDGTVTVSLVGIVPAGARILWIEKEIAPIKSANYSFNATSQVLTLLNGTTVDNEQTLYILYALIITS